MCKWVIVSCLFLDFLNAGLQSSKVGPVSCHFVWRNLLILGFKAVYRILNLSGVKSKANFTAKSVFSFPVNPMWFGIQQLGIFLELNIESNLLSSLIIKESFSSFYFVSEDIIKYLWLLSDFMSSMMSVVWASAKKMEPFFWRAFLWFSCLIWLCTLFYHCSWSHLYRCRDG